MRVEDMAIRDLMRQYDPEFPRGSEDTEAWYEGFRAWLDERLREHLLMESTRLRMQADAMKLVLTVQSRWLELIEKGDALDPENSPHGPEELESNPELRNQIIDQAAWDRLQADDLKATKMLGLAALPQWIEVPATEWLDLAHDEAAEVARRDGDEVRYVPSMTASRDEVLLSATWQRRKAEWRKAEAFEAEREADMLDLLAAASTDFGTDFGNDPL